MTTETEPRTEPVATPSGGPADHPAGQLRALLVRYDHRPDRRTICPAAPGPRRLTTAWLTADASAFYDLAEVR